MSYILKALRKAEFDRLRNQSPSINSGILQPPQPVERKHHWTVVLAVCNVILLLLLFGYFFRSNLDKRTDRPEPEVAEERSVEIRPKPVTDFEKPKTVVAPRPESMVSKPKPAEQKAQASIAQLISKHKKPNKSGARTRDLAGLPNPFESDFQPQGEGSENHRSPYPVDHQKIKRFLDHRGSTEVPSPGRSGLSRLKPVSTEESPQIDPEKKQKDTDSGGEIPWLRELPYEFRKTVPPLDINVYAYSDDIRERFIILNMVRYGEGDKLAEGLVLQRIGAEALVLTYSGKTFRIKRP